MRRFSIPLAVIVGLFMAAPALAQEEWTPDVGDALIAQAMKEGTCEPEGVHMLRCTLSAILIDGVRTIRPIVKATPRQAAYVTVIAAPAPDGVLIVQASAHQERWAVADGRVIVQTVLLNLIEEKASGHIQAFVDDTRLEASLSFSPSHDDIQSTLRLLHGLFLATKT